MQSPESPASCGVNCFDGHRFNNYKAQSHTPDIIITDYMMPVTDGMEMSRQLRTQEATNHIPIIMLSAKTDDDSKIHGMEQASMIIWKSHSAPTCSGHASITSWQGKKTCGDIST